MHFSYGFPTVLVVRGWGHQRRLRAVFSHCFWKRYIIEGKSFMALSLFDTSLFQSPSATSKELGRSIIIAAEFTQLIFFFNLHQRN